MAKLARAYGADVDLHAFQALKEVHIGLTATRIGLTLMQRKRLQQILRRFCSGQLVWLHHGDCTGGDDDGHDCARELGFRIHSHPSTLTDQRAFNRCDKTEAPKPPLDRNRDIVTMCHFLIGCPYEMGGGPTLWDLGHHSRGSSAKKARCYHLAGRHFGDVLWVKRRLRPKKPASGSVSEGDKVRMIETRTGNILQAGTQALVVPVNTVGVMGAGLALQVKGNFPECFGPYVEACKGAGPGNVWSVRLQNRPFEWLLFFTTKDHWRNPTRVEYIRAGLPKLVRLVSSLDIRTVAIPALGCGLGGLSYSLVGPLIRGSFKKLEKVTAHLYPPDTRRMEP